MGAGSSGNIHAFGQDNITAPYGEMRHCPSRLQFLLEGPEQIAVYKYEIADVLPENIAYVDETGIDQYLYRQYGYAPRGKLVHGHIRGRKYAWVDMVAAQMGKKILAPYQYSGTMDHAMFEDWFENKLLPVLPDGTVIVMDETFQMEFLLVQKTRCSQESVSSLKVCV